MNSALQSLERVWDDFFKREQILHQYQEQFRLYLELLCEWNKKMNLTAITNPADIITYHFQDSLSIGHCIDFQRISGIGDIGAGAGFPGIPIKIKYPHISLVLIEVNQKKIIFLNAVIDALHLKDVHVCPFDWRTFLRKTNYAVDLFLARASLQPEQLLRMFKATSSYRQATLVYWASKKWQVTKELAPYVERQEQYMVGAKNRKLVFFTTK